jgi:hypothetical protein
LALLQVLSGDFPVVKGDPYVCPRQGRHAEQRVNHQLRRRIRHLEHNLRDITARCNAERECRMSLEALVGGKIIIFI